MHEAKVKFDKTTISTLISVLLLLLHIYINIASMHSDRLETTTNKVKKKTDIFVKAKSDCEHYLNKYLHAKIVWLLESHYIQVFVLYTRILVKMLNLIYIEWEWSLFKILGERLHVIWCLLDYWVDVREYE